MNTELTNADKLLFRASGNGNIMTAINKSVEDAMTCNSYLKKMYRELRYERRQEITTKYTEKGLSQEEDAITLLSRVTGIVFKKNDERLKNDYVSGEPDIYIGKDIRKAEEGYDTKCSWGLWSFPYKGDKLDPDYYWQNQTYMALTGAKKWTTAFCLVNASTNLIDAEKKKVYFSMGCPDDTNAIYKNKCIEIEKNMIFDLEQFKSDNPVYDMDCSEWTFDIPKEERVILFPALRDEAAINKLYGRIQDCRDWMNAFLFNHVTA